MNPSPKCTESNCYHLAILVCQLLLLASITQAKFQQAPSQPQMVGDVLGERDFLTWKLYTGILNLRIGPSSSNVTKKTCYRNLYPSAITRFTW